MSTPHSYALLSTDEREARAAAGSGNATEAKQPMRYVVVVLVGLIAAFYVATSFRSTAQSQWSKTRSTAAAPTIFGRYEKHKLQTENAALKERLAQMQQQLQQQQNEAMLRAASGASAALKGDMPAAVTAAPIPAAAAASSGSAASTPPALRDMLRNAAAAVRLPRPP